MEDQYRVITISDDNKYLTKFDFYIQYSLIEWLYCPVILTAIFVGISSYLAIEIRNFEMPVWVKLLMVGGCLVISILLFLFAFKNGKFVLGANVNGIFFGNRNDKKTLTFINWKDIENLEMFNDGSRELEIQTSITNLVNLPKPCNGSSYMNDGKLVIALRPGMRRSTNNIITKLQNIKQLNKK